MKTQNLTPLAVLFATLLAALTFLDDLPVLDLTLSAAPGRLSLSVSTGAQAE